MENSIIKQLARAKHKKKSVIRFAFVFALAGISFTAQAGKITSIPSASGAEGFAGWNLDNVEVVLNGTQGSIGDPNTSWFNELDGTYNFAEDSNFTYAGHVFDDNVSTTRMGYVLAKDWPVGEPAGIKIVNDDLKVEGKPTNCIISTSYLDDHFLDTEDPQQVICSGPFQSHKRYKLAMLPSTVADVVAGTGPEKGIDLVFNVEADVTTRDYQVFQKINNWTDDRLEGFTIQVGFGTGISFQTIAVAGVDVANLSLSVPDDIWEINQLANFSSALFGPEDTAHGRPAGYFDPANPAGFFIDEYPIVSGVTDILHATKTLGSDYADIPAGALAAVNQFGPWLSNRTLPYGIFFDDDGDPSTDPVLQAWYGYSPAESGLAWMEGAAGNFAKIPDSEIIKKGENLFYTMGKIDDLVKVNLNYIVTVGDISSFPGYNADPASNAANFTIRITPTKDTSLMTDPGFAGALPNPSLLFRNADAAVLLEPEPYFRSGDLLTARVGDADLNLASNVVDTVDVTISTNTDLSTTLTLIEQCKDCGVFVAILPDEYSNVDVGTTVTMTYIDADTGTATNVTKTSSTTATAELPATSSSSGCSCAYSPDGSADPLLPGLVVASLIYLGWRSRRSGVK